MKNFETLRKKYDTFIYKNYKIQQNENDIKIEYNFEIPNLKNFKPIIEIEKKNINISNLNNKIIENIVFNLGMVEAISYWKSVCSKEFIVECGSLDSEQIEWYKKLFYLGLGEFRYINNIKISNQNFINIITKGKAFEKAKENQEELLGNIIPIGGGKDSCVTLELLKKYKKDNLCITVGNKSISKETAKIAGYNDNQIISINRKIDENLIELNKAGFLNGHTPFSALLAFLTYLVAVLTQRKYITLSNESSANETNVTGENINHQYSKTIEFENDFREYVQKYINAGPEYFSILRPLNELQIAKLFSSNKKYHSIFKSCNVGSKKEEWEWCCNCSKCLFVYIILSPFLYKNGLVEIFKEDLFNKKELLQTFIDLTGNGKTKPFECVGTFEEVNYCIVETIEELERKDKELPYLLEYYKEKYGLKDNIKDVSKIYNSENNLPEEYDKILRKKILK